MQPSWLHPTSIAKQKLLILLIYAPQKTTNRLIDSRNKKTTLLRAASFKATWRTVNSRTHPSQLIALCSTWICKEQIMPVKSEIMKTYYLLPQVSRGKDQLTIQTNMSVSGVKRVSAQESPSKGTSVTAGSSQQLPLLPLIQKESSLCSQAKMNIPQTELSK